MQALDLARRQGERGNEAHALRVLGSIAARSPSAVVTDAETAFRDGIKVADQLEMRPVAALCHLGLATLLGHSARAGEAPQHLQTALGLFEAMGARVLLERAQRDGARAS
jgi:hypothetical protein